MTLEHADKEKSITNNSFYIQKNNGCQNENKTFIVTATKHSDTVKAIERIVAAAIFLLSNTFCVVNHTTKIDLSLSDFYVFIKDRIIFVIP